MDWLKKQVKAHPIVSVVVVILIIDIGMLAIGAIVMALDDNTQTEYDIKEAEEKTLEGNIDKAAAQRANSFVRRWRFINARDAVSDKTIKSNGLRSRPRYMELFRNGTGTIYFDGANDLSFSWEVENNKLVFSGVEGVLNKQGGITIRTGGVLSSLKPTILYYFFEKE